ncbi:YqaA family protein [Vibrio sp. MA40-2]|uniref:YqaA family protein n=1 Tax=Vibrio sp. MA40-2 TaxID=3391828 RepID=UPI0039A55B57
MLEPLYLYFTESALWVLGISGFFSATLLPGASEATFIATLNTHQYTAVSILLVATLGNTLGGVTNYWIGFWLPHRTSKEKYGHKAVEWLHKYGYAALLLSWLPVIGDPLCLVAGWLRMKFMPCIMLIAFGKAIRYSFLLALYFGFF